MKSRARWPWLASVAIALAPRASSANAFDVEGFGPVGVAEVNARAARADDGTATFYNPAGLGFGRGVRVEVAPTLGVSALEAQGHTIALQDPFGVALAFDATIPFEGVLKDRVRFGFGSYLLPTNVLRIVAHASDQPFFPYFDNRTQRLVVLPALGIKLVHGLAIGGGVNVGGGVSGPASVLTGSSGAPESRIDVQASTRVAAVAGVRFDPTDTLHTSLSFRQRFYVPTNIDTQATVGGVPLKVAVDAAEDLFDPDTFVFATAFDEGPLSIEVDGAIALWSSYTGPFVDVHASLPGVNIESNLPASIARDVGSLRAAAAYRIEMGDHRLVLHGGAGFEPSMLKDFQQGRTNLLDGDKVFVGLGLSLELAHVVARTVRLGLGVNTTVVTHDEQDKRVCLRLPCGDDTVTGDDSAHPGKGIDNPGYPKLNGGGSFWSGSFGIGVDL